VEIFHVPWGLAFSTPLLSGAIGYRLSRRAIMAEHEKTEKTLDKRHEGEHGTRDRVNDPRRHSGEFARQHHEAADTVDAALKGLEDQGEKNRDELLSGTSDAGEQQEPTQQEIEQSSGVGEGRKPDASEARDLAELLEGEES
jgi:hypothetical protein